ncbi:MAG: dihydrofolate reductase [Bacteroidota bacterium]|nr:dihydrofolate reductase [Bacteroidota bacterium]
MISHIVAASENNIIGIKNGLPWKLSNDFKYFKNKTWGMPVIMGRNTFESLKKDLPGRINIVVTKKSGWQPENVFVAHNISDAIKKAVESDAREIFIIGGGQIFKQTIEMTNRVYLTRVHTTIEGDTSYPELESSKWKRLRAESFPADEKNNFPYTFEVWEKIDAA